MQGLTATGLLDVWERGRALTSVRRAFVLLQAACPDVSTDDLMTWTVGMRDARLFLLRERTFGSTLQARAACTACQTQLEMEFGVADLCVPNNADPSTIMRVSSESDSVQFRLPTLRDLDLVTQQTLTNSFQVETPSQQPPHGDTTALVSRSTVPEMVVSRTDAARLQLLHRCMVTSMDGGPATPIELLPKHLTDEIERQMTVADSNADVRLDLHCEACGHQWQAPFDIASFLWNEIQAYSQRLLREVHQLASAYGWSEHQILSLSPVRRFHYLELVGT